MIRKISIVFLFSILLFCLTGCWDQITISEKTLINGISFDLTEDKKVDVNALILDILGKGIGVYELKNKYIESKENSVFESGIKMQSSIPGDIETSKTRIFLLGEEFAKENMIPLLDTFDRRRVPNLNVKVAITKGVPAKSLLTIQSTTKPLSFILTDIIKAGEDISVAPKMNLMEMLSLGTEEGIDFVLPILEVKKEDTVELVGSGLLHDGKYTGHFVHYKDCPLLMMMMDTFGQNGWFVTQLPETKELRKPYNRVSYEIVRSRRKFTVHVSKNKVTVGILLRPKAVITEITTEKNVSEKELKSIIQEDLNKRAETIMKELQLSNSDVFGIGRYVKAHYPKTWKKLDWEKEFPSISIRTKVKVDIENTGSKGELTKSVK